jgi:hypothetical protein
MSSEVVRVTERDVRVVDDEVVDEKPGRSDEDQPAQRTGPGDHAPHRAPDRRRGGFTPLGRHAPRRSAVHADDAAEVRGEGSCLDHFERVDTGLDRYCRWAAPLAGGEEGLELQAKGLLAAGR